MSLDATRWAWTQHGLRPLHKLILLSLADRAGPDNTVWPSYDQLIEDTGADRKTIWQAINSMKASGLLIDTGERKGKTGQVPVLRLVGVQPRKSGTEQFRKGNDSENGTVPFFLSNSSENGTGNSSENGIRNLPIEPTKEPTNESEQARHIHVEQKKKGKAKSQEMTLADFIAKCKAEGVSAIADDDPVWDIAEKAGIDDEMIGIAWLEFKRYWLATKKCRADWRETFRNAVRQNRASIWMLREGEPARWTTAGETMRREAA